LTQAVCGDQDDLKRSASTSMLKPVASKTSQWESRASIIEEGSTPAHASSVSATDLDSPDVRSVLFPSSVAAVAGKFVELDNDDKA
jgi:hypothetical protein